MTDHTDLIARADAALDGVTPGPWTFKVAANGDCGITALGCGVFLEAYADIRFQGEDASYEAKANATFLSESRQLVPDLRAALAAMTAERDALRAENATLTAEAPVVEAEVKRLREALRQCGNFADWGGEVERLVGQALATDASAEGGEG